ncbi:hypothetical protein BD779DRAFT_1012161 [Infundibulicybe gibba]|nr:hypothetical protein BD779DRAFT_1012161 [Infundibulicybe gibba]
MALTAIGNVILGVVLEGIFYGIYMVLFILYLVLRRRNNRAVGGLLTLAQMLLFGLCTISSCLDITGGYLLVVNGTAASEKFDLGSMSIYAVVDCLAQMILLYRCWIIWDRRWAIVAVPGFLSLVALGGGLALVGLYNSPLWNTDIEKIVRLFKLTGTTTYSTSLGVNALTTSLIVARIFLTSREVRPVLGSDSHRSLRIAIAMLAESGLLMFTFQLVLVILFSCQRSVFGIISGPRAQIYGITPTLLNTRVIMGTAYDKTTEKTRSLRFAHSGGAATQTTGPSMSVAGIQSRRGINAELDDASSNGGAANDAV